MGMGMPMSNIRAARWCCFGEVFLTITRIRNVALSVVDPWECFELQCEDKHSLMYP